MAYISEDQAYAGNPTSDTIRMRLAKIRANNDAEDKKEQLKRRKAEKEDDARWRAAYPEEAERFDTIMFKAHEKRLADEKRDKEAASKTKAWEDTKKKKAKLSSTKGKKAQDIPTAVPTMNLPKKSIREKAFGGIFSSVEEGQKRAAEIERQEALAKQRANWDIVAEEAKAKKEEEDRVKEQTDMAEWRVANPDKADVIDEQAIEAKADAANAGTKDKPWGGAVGESMRDAIGVAGGITPSITGGMGLFGKALGGMLTSGAGKPPPEGWQPIDYQTNSYVGIFDTYEPISKTYRKLDYKPMSFDDFEYEPYVHLEAAFKPMDWKPYVHQPSEWTPSEYDELVYEETDMSAPPYVSPIISPEKYVGMPNELTPNDGDILYDNRGQTWANSPLFKGTGLADGLFGKGGEQPMESPALVETDDGHHPMTEDLGVAEELMGINNNADAMKPTGMAETLFGMGSGEQNKPWETSPVFKSTAEALNLWSNEPASKLVSELPTQPVEVPVVAVEQNTPKPTQLAQTPAVPRVRIPLRLLSRNKAKAVPYKKTTTVNDERLVGIS